MERLSLCRPPSIDSAVWAEDRRPANHTRSIAPVNHIARYMPCTPMKTRPLPCARPAIRKRPSRWSRYWMNWPIRSEWIRSSFVRRTWAIRFITGSWIAQLARSIGRNEIRLRAEARARVNAAWVAAQGPGEAVATINVELMLRLGATAQF